MTNHTNGTSFPDHAKLTAIDVIAVTVYFVIVVCLGIYATYKSKKGSTSGYFLAGKSINWFLIGASLLASNVGAPFFVALSGGAAASGIAITIYEWHAVFMLILLGWIFVPVYTASGCFTMPEYLKKRYGGNRLRIYLSLISLVMYILTKISAEIYAGALFIRVVLNWDLYLSIVLIVSVTALYTITGGLLAVIYTDTLQAIIVVISASIVSVIGIVKVGGWNELKRQYMDSYSSQTKSDFSRFHNHTCGLARNDSFHIFRDPVTSDLPWTGAIFGLTPIALWVWCNDQLMVQRTLAAKNLSHAKGGALFASYLKILPFFLFVIPGLVSRILYPEEVACASPEACTEVCQNKDGCSNIAYPLIVVRLLPEGLRGIMLAALLAALMSSLTSIFNSASSMFTLDIYKHIRKKAKATELLIVGRLFVVVLVGVSIAWIPILEKSEGGLLWNYLNAISANITPPWCVVFVLGVFWTRTTEKGAFWGLMAGMVVGAIRMVLDFYYKSIQPACGSPLHDITPAIVKKVHFLHFSIILTVISTLVTVVVSLCTTPRPEKLPKRTWWTRHEVLEAVDSEPDEFSDYEQCATDEYTAFLNADPDLKNNGDQETDQDVVADILLPKFHVPLGKKILLCLSSWFCGYEPENQRVKMTRDEQRAERDRLTSIQETKYMKWFLNVNALICMAVTCTLLAIFG